MILKSSSIFTRQSRKRKLDKVYCLKLIVHLKQLQPETKLFSFSVEIWIYSVFLWSVIKNRSALCEHPQNSRVRLPLLPYSSLVNGEVIRAASSFSHGKMAILKTPTLEKQEWNLKQKSVFKYEILSLFRITNKVHKVLCLFLCRTSSSSLHEETEIVQSNAMLWYNALIIPHFYCFHGIPSFARHVYFYITKYYRQCLRLNTSFTWEKSHYKTATKK